MKICHNYKTIRENEKRTVKPSQLLVKKIKNSNVEKEEKKKKKIKKRIYLLFFFAAAFFLAIYQNTSLINYEQVNTFTYLNVTYIQLLFLLLFFSAATIFFNAKT